MNEISVNLRVNRFDADGIVRNWSWVGPLLAPSVRIAGRKVEDVKLALLKDEMGMASVHVPNGAGLIVMQPAQKSLWLAYAAFRLKAAPKEWLRVIRALAAYFEDLAREAGCTEIFLGGRDWSRVLVGYEPQGSDWKKVL